MEFYFIVHLIIGITLGATANTQKLAAQFPSQVPRWAWGSWGSLSAIGAVFSAIAAIITTGFQYPLVWSLATIGEIVLGVFAVGLMPQAIRFLLALIAIPANALILGALWGFWYL